MAELAATSNLGNESHRYGSTLRFEAHLELGIELVKANFYLTGDAAPAVILQRSDGDSQFQLQGVCRLKVSTAVAPQDFYLTVYRLDHIAGGQATPQGVGILEKGKIVVAFLT